MIFGAIDPVDHGAVIVAARNFISHVLLAWSLTEWMQPDKE